MTERRNLEKELSYWVYNDPEYGDDITNLDYPALIGLLGELIDRVETLEKSKTDMYNDLASSIKQAAREVFEKND
jgi:hypothetical protein